MPLGNERTNFLPIIDAGAVVACKRDENPMKNEKKKQLRSEYFMRKYEQFSYLFLKKGYYRMIKLTVNLKPWDF